MKQTTNFNYLPATVQQEVKDILKVYDEVNVWYENGEYSFADVLKSEYAPDHRYIGTYRKEDVYTEIEQIENYINEFHTFPINYKGKRDYAMLHKMDDERECKLVETENPNIKKLACTDWYGKINENGNFELTERKTVLI